MQFWLSFAQFTVLRERASYLVSTLSPECSTSSWLYNGRRRPIACFKVEGKGISAGRNETLNGTAVIGHGTSISLPLIHAKINLLLFLVSGPRERSNLSPQQQYHTWGCQGSKSVMFYYIFSFLLFTPVSFTNFFQRNPSGQCASFNCGDCLVGGFRILRLEPSSSPMFSSSGSLWGSGGGQHLQGPCLSAYVCLLSGMCAAHTTFISPPPKMIFLHCTTLLSWFLGMNRLIYSSGF